MKLIAKKPCSFGGKEFYIGNEIPTEYVINPGYQEKLGVLTIVSEDGGAVNGAAPQDGSKVEFMEITIPVEEGDFPLTLTRDGLESAITVLTGKADDAEEVIEKMTDGDSLILLHMLDSRKTVKAAAEARAKALNEDPENPEDPENTEDPQESEGEQ